MACQGHMPKRTQSLVLTEAGPSPRLKSFYPRSRDSLGLNPDEEGGPPSEKESNSKPFPAPNTQAKPTYHERTQRTHTFGGMAQQAQRLTAEPDNLSPVTGPHRTEGAKRLL